MPMPQTLPDWLSYIEQQHPSLIDMGLARTEQVRDALNLPRPSVLITVGGTNGKGSTCAMLEAILRAAGYSVGLYTSPHLLRYNERVRINAQEASDQTLCESFAAIEKARGDTALTYFEFGTLCAMHCFAQHKVDVVILEVGLGGRLDSVNAFDPDCAIVTSIDLDHMALLGHTREAIGFEKACIYRAGKPAVCGDPLPPQSLIDHAQKIGADLWISGKDFGFNGDRTQWQYRGRTQRRSALAYPALRGANQLLNASCVLAALEALEDKLPVPMQAVRQGFMLVELAGRFQILPGRPSVILDVAHNPHAAAVLEDNLASMGFYKKTYAVCGMLADKDIAGVLKKMHTRIDHWLFCDLPAPRGAKAEQLAQLLHQIAPSAHYEVFPTPQAAFEQAKAYATQDDRITVFGSFLTVADIFTFLNKS